MTTRPEDDLGLDGRVAIVTGGGAADDGIGNGRPEQPRAPATSTTRSVRSISSSSMSLSEKLG